MPTKRNIPFSNTLALSPLFMILIVTINIIVLLKELVNKNFLKEDR